MEITFEKGKNIRQEKEVLSPNCTCVDHVYTLGMIIEGMNNAGLTTYCWFLDVKKAYDEYGVMGCWKRCGKLGRQERHGEWLNISRNAARGNIQICCNFFKSCIMMYTITQYVEGMHQWVGSRKSKRQQGVTIGEDAVSRLIIAVDFVGISETPKGLQKQLPW